MPKSADRPARRLAALLEALRKHGVAEFQGPLPGFDPAQPFTIRFEPREEMPEAGTLSPVSERVKATRLRTYASDAQQQPRDELDLVLEDRNGIEPEETLS